MMAMFDNRKSKKIKRDVRNYSNLQFVLPHDPMRLSF